ncbi:MATE efflux family protein ALF5 [Triticum urartu]|uniref:Protein DETOXIFICATION n=1 Tax=Triticum urartu TaxID=4572 RepID=M8A179_TRIUA|nr:MATE efflux family protein ALF5 [Triticum urartu]
MCNTGASPPPSPPPLTCFKNSSHLLHPVGDHHEEDDDDSHHRARALALSKVAGEARAIGRLSVPMAVTGLVMYSRSFISMLFLGQLGELALAGGSLALGFANITGYSVLSGLALGMEPLCGQAFGARRGKLLALALHRTVLLLLAVALPISLLWITSTGHILKLLGQDEGVASAAQTFAAYASADLAVLAVLHPLRVYLRSQNLTLPITACSLFSVLLHGPINYLLVVRLRMGVAGVALAVALTDLNLLLALLCFLAISGAHRDSWVGPTSDCLRGWGAMLRLAVPTATAVCLEWWWYELMIVLSGLLPNPRATVASMGILIQATSLVYVFPSSLGQGASTRVSHQLGAGRPGGARRLAPRSSSASNAGGSKNKNGYVLISESGNDDALQKLEEGLMPMASSSSIGGSNGDTNAVDRDRESSSFSGSGAVCTAEEGKEQCVSERAPLIRVGDVEEEGEEAHEHDGDGDGRGGGQV